MDLASCRGTHPALAPIPVGNHPLVKAPGCKDRAVTANPEERVPSDIGDQYASARFDGNSFWNADFV